MQHSCSRTACLQRPGDSATVISARMTVIFTDTYVVSGSSWKFQGAEGSYEWLRLITAAFDARNSLGVLGVVLKAAKGAEPLPMKRMPPKMQPRWQITEADGPGRPPNQIFKRAHSKPVRAPERQYWLWRFSVRQTPPKNFFEM